MTKKQIKKLVAKGIIEDCSYSLSSVVFKISGNLHICGTTRYNEVRMTIDLLLNYSLKDFKDFLYNNFFKEMVLTSLSEIKKEEFIDKVFNRKK